MLLFSRFGVIFPHQPSPAFSLDSPFLKDQHDPQSGILQYVTLKF